MARSNPPKFGGAIKIDKDGQNTWIHTFWGLDSGHYRIMVQKATKAEEKAIQEGSLVVVSLEQALELLN